VHRHESAVAAGYVITPLEHGNDQVKARGRRRLRHLKQLEI
jgi:hypothetical protein